MSSIEENGTLLGKIIKDIAKAQIETTKTSLDLHFKMLKGKRPTKDEIHELIRLESTSHLRILELAKIG